MAQLDFPVVAAFDFDGTITTKDSLLSFLRAVVGTSSTVGGVLRALPSLLGVPLGRTSRQKAKERLLSCTLRGRTFEEMQARALAFARDGLSKLIRPEALRRIQWHKERGHRLVLLSATLQLYLTPWGEEHGFDHVIGSLVEVDEQGRLTGRLVGENCRCQEKVVRLEEVLGPTENYILYAYGDSRGDKELLEAATIGYYREMP